MRPIRAALATALLLPVVYIGSPRRSVEVGPRTSSHPRGNCRTSLAPTDACFAQPSRAAAGLASGVPIHRWLSEVSLHSDLAADLEDRFASAPQQPEPVVNNAVERIESAARACVAPSASAHPFGSTVNGFGEVSSDLDIIIAVDDDELAYYMSHSYWHGKEKKYLEAQRRSDEGSSKGGRNISPPSLVCVNSKSAMACAVQQLQDFLPKFGFQVVNALPHARRPLLTLLDRAGDLGECDVSINNRLPLCNTELLRSYAMLDRRVRSLVLFVKAWAKGQGVSGAKTNEGNLSSYAWTIMAIYFLQLVRVVPSLQMLAETPSTVADIDYWGHEREFDNSFLRAEEYLSKERRPRGKRGDGLSLPQLVYGFLRFFGREYRWGSEVVSMRSPDRREADAWWRLYGKCHLEPGIHIEDPIELRDLNIVLRRERLAVLKLALVRATEMLEEGASLEELLSARPLPVPASLGQQRRAFRVPGRVVKRGPQSTGRGA